MSITADKSEIVECQVWKRGQFFRRYFLYIPLFGKPEYSNLSIDDKAISNGDFNSHSKWLGYTDTNLAGRKEEDFLISYTLEFAFKNSDIPTFLHNSNAL